MNATTTQTTGNKLLTSILSVHKSMFWILLSETVSDYGGIWNYTILLPSLGQCPFTDTHFTCQSTTSHKYANAQCVLLVPHTYVGPLFQWIEGPRMIRRFLQTFANHLFFVFGVCFRSSSSCNRLSKMSFTELRGWLFSRISIKATKMLRCPSKRQ